MKQVKFVFPILLLLPVFSFGEGALIKGVARMANVPGKVLVPFLTRDFLKKSGILLQPYNDVWVNYYPNVLNETTQENISSLAGTQANLVTIDPIVFPEAQKYDVGNNSVYLSPAAGVYQTEILWPVVFSLKDSQYPALSNLDQYVSARAANRKGGLVEQKTLVHNEFYASMQSGISEENFPYRSFLPSQKTDILFLGIAHTPEIEEDVINWVRAVKAHYTDRTIYFATEYVWDTIDPAYIKNLPPTKILRTEADLRAQFVSEPAYRQRAFLKDIIEEVPIVGIDPTTAMLDLAQREASKARWLPAHLVSMYEEIATSEAGMELRNKAWAKHIADIFEKDPNALVLVMGGANHIAYSAVNKGVPGLLSDFNSFTILQVNREGKKIINPVMAHLEDRAYQHFAQLAQTNDQARYILTFKQPTGEIGKTVEDFNMYKEILGADVLIVVP